MERLGICTLGNLIVDVMHHVVRYPNKGELSHIKGAREMAVGGLACNTSLVLARLDKNLPIYVSGILGDDTEGRFIREEFARQTNIDTSRVLAGEETAYTVVIDDNTDRQRTFLTSCGSGSLFDAGDIDLTSLPARILHAGYILLMDALDAEDGVYGTRMARLLHDAQALGIKTSIDVVSETGDRFSRLVPPALKYTDYCIINELETAYVTGVPLREKDGSLRTGNIKEALEKIRAFGVSTWAAIHCPEGAFGLDEDSRYIALPSLKLPKGYIKGTTGAGDAFCAGALYGAHAGWTLKDALRLGTASAACSLGAGDSYSGVKPLKETLAFYKEMGGE